MGWGTIEAEPEVTEWLLALDDEDFGQAERYIDLLARMVCILASRSLDSFAGGCGSCGSTSADRRPGSPITSPPAAASFCSPCSPRRGHGSATRSIERGRPCSAASARDT